MNQIFTRTFVALFLILWLGNISASEGQNPNAGATPADTMKKAPPPPPAQLITYPLSLASGKFKLSGYAQVRYQYFTDTLVSNGFDVRRARVTLAGSPFKNFDYKLQADFAPTTRVMDVTAAYTFNTYIKIVAGQQKIPFSLENLISSPLMESINRSQVVEALVSRSRDVISTQGAVVGNNNGRDIGALLTGVIKTQGENARPLVEYSGGLFSGNGINKADNNRELDFSGRVIAYPIKQISIGGSYYNGSATYGKDVSKPKNRDRFGFEVYYNSPRITVKSEFIQGVDSATTRNGYYVQLAGFILPEKFQAVLKYDSYDSNIDKDGDQSTIYTFGLNWLWGKYAKIQAAYDYRKEQGDSDAQKDNDLFSVMLQLGF